VNAAYRVPFHRNASLVIELSPYSRDLARALRDVSQTQGAGTVLAAPEFCS